MLFWRRTWKAFSSWLTSQWLRWVLAVNRCRHIISGKNNSLEPWHKHDFFGTHHHTTRLRITSQACKWMSQRDMNHHSNKSFIHRSLLAAGRPCHRWSVALQQAAPLVHAISSKQATPGFITGDLQQASNTASTCNLRQAVLVSNLLHKIQAWLMSWQLPVATATAILVHTIQKEMPSYLQLFGRPAIPLQPATFADPMSFHLATSLMAFQYSSPCSAHL